jgi:hypothetical protein
MTDATLPVTEQTVEHFVESYLTSLGAEIKKEGRQWSVTLPKDADTDLDIDGAVLEVGRNPDDTGDEILAVAPQSAFVERVLAEAAERCPVGSMSLTGDTVDIETPPWIAEGPVEVVNRAFTPYYDRRALCVLFNVGIETVSEYQSEELRAIAVDLNDTEERPQLAETYLDVIGEDNKEVTSGGGIEAQKVTDAFDTARTLVEDRISSVVHETRKRATRSAEVELNEYREFVHQRRDELVEEIDRLTTRIEEVTDTIETVSEQKQRVEALRKRKQLRAERDELRAEAETLRSQIEANFPEKRRDIWQRYALTVQIRPVTATVISYERGELEVKIRTQDSVTVISRPYAAGSGVIRNAACEQCGRHLSADNPITLNDDQVIGLFCCGTRSD